MTDADPSADAADPAPAGLTHIHLTTESVKVLAHPLRSRMLSILRRNGPATATDLAARLRSNTGATSYHLRRLESVGLVEDTGEGAGKRRLWRASTQSHGWTRSELAGDDDAASAIGWLERDYHRLFDAEYAHWLDVADAWPGEWQDVAVMGDAGVVVTPERLARLNQEIEDVVRRYLDIDAGDPRARRIHVWKFAYPMEADEVPGLDDGSDGNGSDPDRAAPDRAAADSAAADAPGGDGTRPDAGGGVNPGGANPGDGANPGGEHRGGRA
ncbi:ArsR/SmtB family transcription factor [Myceligenerans indicum]|uniref:Helix-turn-helix domain-containing protein n=1 Tax=Myceligenerans indicum TaxID=2593663 RepID=A0ABS1LEE3_9MICO|nr:helix-turn-helix domain-containing protein [Myceligenerans indicum]MBL0884684.1 helix-turn-helix domain-containing protein [Myceligenerans indicum]